MRRKVMKNKKLQKMKMIYQEPAWKALELAELGWTYTDIGKMFRNKVCFDRLRPFSELIDQFLGQRMTAIDKTN